MANDLRGSGPALRNALIARFKAIDPTNALGLDLKLSSAGSTFRSAVVANFKKIDPTNALGLDLDLLGRGSHFHGELESNFEILSGGVVAPSLANLGLSGASFNQGAAAGTIIGSIQNKTGGSSLSITPNDGRVTLDGSNRLIVGLSVASAGPFNITVRETLGGASNSPRDTVFTVTVVAAAVTLGALSMSPNTATVGVAYTGAVNGKTVGSTLSLTGAGAAGLSVSGSTITGTPTTEGTINIVETRAGATNTPRTTNGVATVSAAAGIPAGRVAPITRTLYDTAPVVPPSYPALVRSQSMDANLHPSIGTTTATAIKNGNWSDPTVWASGTVPGAGAIVNYGDYDVLYDMFSDTLIKGIHVGGKGVFRVKPDMRTRLRIATPMIHGTVVMGEKGNLMQLGPSGGQTNCEILFHMQGVTVGTSVLFGFNTMGAVRIACVPFKVQLDIAARTLAVGATSCVVPGLASSAWRVGDEIVIPATDYDAPTSTDSTYSGPSTYWNDIDHSPSLTTGDLQQYNATSGFFQSQDERRVITGINLGTETVTWSGGLTYAHEGLLRTIPVMGHDGVQTTLEVDIKPRIVLLTRPIQMRTASPNNSSDLAADPSLTPINGLNRAHAMFMHSDEIEIDGIRFTDMGRSFIDPTMVQPGGPLHYSAAPGVPGRVQITNPLNVQGRYACHFHWTGPYIGRKIATGTRLVVDSSPNEIPTPGWGITHHGSNVFLEDCVTLRTRGAGIATELGSEIGQWINCTSMHNIGDGFPPVLEGRSEFWRGHNGHSGEGFECQARNVQMVGCLATSSHTGYLWQTQQDSYADRMVQDVSLRYRNPVSQGGDNSDDTPLDRYGPADEYGIYPADLYGKANPQIPPAHRNMSWGCGRHAAVIHRSPQRQDDTPMVWSESHALRCGSYAAFGPYSNSYFFYNSACIGKGTGEAFRFLGVSWRWWVVSCYFEGFDVEVQDGGAGLNYEGQFVNNSRDAGLPIRLGSSGYNSEQPNNITTYDWYNLMDDMQVDPGNPKRAITRVWKDRDFSYFPTIYPLPPYGAHLDGSHPAVPLGGTPYFVDMSEPGQTWLGGGVRNQMIIKGIIRTSAGDRKFGDWMSGESFPNGAVVKEGVHTSKMTGEQAVIRNGAFRVDGNWFIRFAFPELAPLEGKLWWAFVDRPINPAAFPADFLLAHEITDIDSVYGDPMDFFKPEALPAITNFAKPTVAPLFTSVSSLTVPENEKLSLVLLSDDGHVKFAIAGGPDAGQVQIAGALANTVQWIGDGTQGYEPGERADANGDSIYTFTARLTDNYGNTRDQVINISVTDVNENFPTHYEDEFLLPNGTYLEDTGNWSTMSGGQPHAAYEAYEGVFPAFENANTVYVSPARTTANQFTAARTSGSQNGCLIAMCISGNGDFIGWREYAGYIRAEKFVSGVSTPIYDAPTNRAPSGNRMVRVELSGTTFSHYEDGVLISTFALPVGFAPSNKQGIYINGNVNFAADYFACGSL